MDLAVKSTIATIIIVGGMFFFFGNPTEEDMARSQQFREIKAKEQQIANKRSRLFPDCETALKASLKSPSSYKFIDKFVLPDELQVYIDYDAINSYGASLRGKFECKFEMGDGDYINLIEASDDFKPLDSNQLYIAQMGIIKARFNMH